MASRASSSGGSAFTGAGAACEAWFGIAGAGCSGWLAGVGAARMTGFAKYDGRRWRCSSVGVEAAASAAPSAIQPKSTSIYEASHGMPGGPDIHQDHHRERASYAHVVLHTFSFHFLFFFHASHLLNINFLRACPKHLHTEQGCDAHSMSLKWSAPGTVPS